MTAALLALLLFPPGVLLDTSPPTSHLTVETLENVVYVSAGPSSGTAFLMRHRDGRYLVTARHVVAPHLEDAEVPMAFVVGGKRGRPIRGVHLLREDPRSDVAVFTFDEDPRNPYFDVEAGLRPEGEPALASQVFLIGYPASLRQTYGSSQLRVVGGWVAGVKKYVPGSTVEYVDVDMPGVEHGHSGGPIILLQDRVVALAVQRRTGSISSTIGATYAVPIKYVTALIDDVPVEEDVTALNDALRGTTLVCGVSLQGKNDFDVWAQRIHRETGEPIWGELGVSVASSSSPEAAFVLVPSVAESTLVVHTIEQPDGSDSDVLAQRLTRYGELLYEGGRASRSVAGTTRPEREPDAVADGNGGAVVVFVRELEDGDCDVVAQRIDADGQRLWTPTGVPVGSAPVEERRPRAVPDGSGGALVVFERVLAGGDVDVVAQRVGPDGVLGWHDGLRSAEIACSARREARPLAVSDGEGGAIVVFEGGLEDGRRVAVAQRISPHGDLLWNGGVPVVLSAFPLADGNAPIRVLADGLGGAFVAWEVVTSGERPEDVDVAVQHVDGTGRLVWGSLGDDGVLYPVLAASSRFAERQPELASDGQGGIVVAFESGSEHGDLDVWAQRIDAQGRLRWYDGRRSSEISLTFLEEHTVRILERDRDRMLFAFEIERDGGRSTVACQALDLETGRALFGGGKVPLFVVDPRDAEVAFHLGVR